jgi:hypothetical protein
LHHETNYPPEDWKIGRLEDWKIGRLEDFALRVVCLMEDCAAQQNLPEVCAQSSMRQTTRKISAGSLSHGRLCSTAKSSDTVLHNLP